MVDDIEKLRIEAQPQVLSHGEPFRQIEVIPHKIRATQCVASEISKLAVLRVIAAQTGSCARIDGRDESVGIEPLDRTQLGYARNMAVATVWIYAGDETGELRTAALDDAATVRRIRRAQYGKRNPAMPEYRARQLLAIHDVAK